MPNRVSSDVLPWPSNSSSSSSSSNRHLIRPVLRTQCVFRWMAAVVAQALRRVEVPGGNFSHPPATRPPPMEDRSRTRERNLRVPRTLPRPATTSLRPRHPNPDRLRGDDATTIEPVTFQELASGGELGTRHSLHQTRGGSPKFAPLIVAVSIVLFAGCSPSIATPTPPRTDDATTEDTSLSPASTQAYECLTERGGDTSS